MPSSSSYGMVKECFISRSYRQGVEVCQMNPAFSSVIGRVKFMERYGLCVHQAAALELARRLRRCSEGIPPLTARTMPRLTSAPCQPPQPLSTMMPDRQT